MTREKIKSKLYPYGKDSGELVWVYPPNVVMELFDHFEAIIAEKDKEIKKLKDKYKWAVEHGNTQDERVIKWIKTCNELETELKESNKRVKNLLDENLSMELQIEEPIVECDKCKYYKSGECKLEGAINFYGESEPNWFIPPTRNWHCADFERKEDD